MSTKSIGTAIWQVLRDDAEFMTSIASKVYPVQLPPSVSYPAVVYGQVSENAISTKDGPVKDGWRWQIDTYATTYARAQEIAQDIRTRLDWYTAAIVEVGNIRVSFLDQTDNLYEQDKELFKITQDYLLRKN